jgi:hypothetical protein
LWLGFSLKRSPKYNKIPQSHIIKEKKVDKIHWLIDYAIKDNFWITILTLLFINMPLLVIKKKVAEVAENKERFDKFGKLLLDKFGKIGTVIVICIISFFNCLVENIAMMIFGLISSIVLLKILSLII